MCVCVNAQARARTESGQLLCAHKQNLLCSSCKSWPTGFWVLQSDDSYLAKFWTKLNLHADCISKRIEVYFTLQKKKIHAMYGFFSVFPSIRVFSNESGLCIRWPKYWSFSFSISPSNEYSEFIFFRMDWHAAVHGVTKCQTQLNDWTTITAMNLCWRWG